MPAARRGFKAVRATRRGESAARRQGDASDREPPHGLFLRGRARLAAARGATPRPRRGVAVAAQPGTSPPVPNAHVADPT
jgi:hypothetical protein